MKLKQIAEQINALSDNYKIGRLQEIRKDIKNLKRRAGSKIFSDDTISEEDGWAYHFGGRKELQFNIGFEKEYFRYGFAFSLEPSQTLPDVSILYPKILKLNCLIRENPSFFENYGMWYFTKHRSKTTPVTQIPTEIIKPKTFIFIGKLCKKSEIDFKEILSTFDELLNIYLAVESEKAIPATSNKDSQNFIFKKNNSKLTFNKQFTSKQRDTNIEVRHSFLQINLQEDLEHEFGTENVAIEHPFLGNRIDIVVKNKDQIYFYEVKVASTAKNCIRQALGQLFEYAYWGGAKNANKILIAGEHAYDIETKNYIEFLNNQFNIPIEYKQIKTKNA